MTFRLLAKYLITLGCEMVWIYYVLLILNEVEWKSTSFPSLMLWVFPIALGGFVYYITTKFFTQSLWQYIFSLLIFLGFLSYVWFQVTVEASAGAQIAIALSLLFLFTRSIYFVRNIPVRKHILLRFEGSICLYIFLVIFNQKYDISMIYHFYFLVCILLSLIGMFFTLYSEEQGTEDFEQSIVLKQAGKPGFLPVFIMLFFTCSLSFSLLFFIPAVRLTMFNILQTSWNGLLYVGAKLLSFIGWLLSFVPASDLQPIEMEPPNGQANIGANEQADTLLQIPITEIIILTIVLLCLASLWFFFKWRKSNKREGKGSRIQFQTIDHQRTGLFAAFFKRLLLLCLQRFPAYYRLPIFWKYGQFLRWGKKQGYPRLPHETPREYAERVLSALEKEDQKFTKTEVLQLTEQYCQAYYRNV